MIVKNSFAESDYIEQIAFFTSFGAAFQKSLPKSIIVFHRNGSPKENNQKPLNGAKVVAI